MSLLGKRQNYYQIRGGRLVKVERRKFIDGPCQVFVDGQYFGTTDGLETQIEKPVQPDGKETTTAN